MLSISCNVKSRKNMKTSWKITKIKLFTNKHNWKKINFLADKDDWKNFKKIIEQFLLKLCILKKKKYILPMYQNITEIMKNRLFFK